MSFCPPVSTATCICTMALLNAVPPASASRPTEDNAVANPRICGCVSPTCDPDAARRDAMFMISDSVVAKLLPRSTSDDPKFRNCPCAMPVIFANCAMDVAASFAARLVELPRSTIVRVNDSRFSFLMPNCPAFSITPAMVPVSVAISVDIRLMDSARRPYSSSDASTVFRTPAKALSKSMEAFIAPTPSAIIGAVTYRLIVRPSAPIFAPAAAAFPENAVSALPAFVHPDSSLAISAPVVFMAAFASFRPCLALLTAS